MPSSDAQLLTHKPSSSCASQTSRADPSRASPAALGLRGGDPASPDSDPKRFVIVITSLAGPSVGGVAGEGVGDQNQCGRSGSSINWFS